MDHGEQDDDAGEVEMDGDAPVSTFDELCARYLPEFAAPLDHLLLAGPDGRRRAGGRLPLPDCLADAGAWRLSVRAILAGGVTAAWVTESVGYFLQAVRRAERLLQRELTAGQRTGRRQPSSPVH